MKKFIGIISILLIIIIVALGSSFVENVDASEICVIQDPIDGELHVYTTAGLKTQGFGTVTKYKKSSHYWFSSKDGEGHDIIDQSCGTRFNDGANGRVSGSTRWEFPLGTDHVLELHKKYGSQDAIEKALIKTVIDKSVYMSGPLLSSKESYSEKKNELIFYIQDQSEHGIYKTVSKEKRAHDPITGKDMTVTVVTIDIDSTSKIIRRQEESPFNKFGITLHNFAINDIVYDDIVEKQISSQQTAIMQVQTAIAQAKEAEQRQIKAEKDGQARATQAKWDQEVLKAQQVTEAEQKREVARLASEEAEFYKKEQILKGEGEGARKRLIMQADGALEKKLTAYVEVNARYAEAIQNYKGSWVPGVLMGAGANGNNGSSGAQDLINMYAVKTAKDLSLDLSIPR